MANGLKNGLVWSWVHNGEIAIVDANIDRYKKGFGVLRDLLKKNHVQTCKNVLFSNFQFSGKMGGPPHKNVKKKMFGGAPPFYGGPHHVLFEI